MPIPKPSSDTCWLYLIRHGETDHNRAKPPRLQGQNLDDHLSDAGREQARRTGEFLRNAPLKAVYSSPLLRAHETAQAVAQHHGVTVQAMDAFLEVNVGDWEGLDWNEVTRDYPEAYEAFMRDAANNPYHGGESMNDVRRRVAPAFEELMARHVGQSIAVVAHNVVNKAFLAHVLDYDLANFRNLPQDNCGVNILQMRKGKTRIATINSVLHLADHS